MAQTHVEVIIRSDKVEHAKYLLQKEHRLFPGRMLFLGATQDLTEVLHECHFHVFHPGPLDEQSMQDLASLVMTGMILGFIVRGEIRLGETQFDNTKDA